MNKKLLIAGIISASIFTSSSAWAILGLSRIIPQNLTDSDIALMMEHARAGMDNQAEGTVLSWSNPETKNRGTVKLIRSFTISNASCRTVHHEVDIDRDADNFAYTSTICKDSGGEWQIMP